MYEKGTEEMTRSPRITSKTGSPIEIWKLPVRIKQATARGVAHSLSTSCETVHWIGGA